MSCWTPWKGGWVGRTSSFSGSISYKPARTAPQEVQTGGGGGLPSAFVAAAAVLPSERSMGQLFWGEVGGWVGGLGRGGWVGGWVGLPRAGWDVGVFAVVRGQHACVDQGRRKKRRRRMRHLAGEKRRRRMHPPLSFNPPTHPPTYHWRQARSTWPPCIFSAAPSRLPEHKWRYRHPSSWGGVGGWVGGWVSATKRNRRYVGR